MGAHYYNVDLKWLNDRKGEVSSPGLPTTIEIATPPEFPKGIEGVWSPEHLFTAAVNSCFMTTFLAIAENSKLEFTQFDCTAKGKLEQVDGKFLMTEVLLEPSVTIVNGSDSEKAEKVIQKAEAACLIANSIKTHVLVHPTVSLM